MKKYNKVIKLLLLIFFFLPFSFVGHAQESIRGGHTVDKQTEKEVFAILDAYLDGFNNQNMKQHFATYHFPHYRLASGKLTILENTGDSVKYKKGLLQSDWHHSRWDHRNIIQASENKIHVDTRFTRYRADGSVIASYESLYILTKENGRWGIKMRSSFAE
jgi:hypothetical protein